MLLQFCWARSEVVGHGPFWDMSNLGQAQEVDAFHSASSLRAVASFGPPRAAHNLTAPCAGNPTHHTLDAPSYGRALLPPVPRPHRATAICAHVGFGPPRPAPLCTHSLVVLRRRPTRSSCLWHSRRRRLWAAARGSAPTTSRVPLAPAQRRPARSPCNLQLPHRRAPPPPSRHRRASAALHFRKLEHQARVARPTNDHHSRDECRFQ